MEMCDIITTIAPVDTTSTYVLVLFNASNLDTNQYFSTLSSAIQIEPSEISIN